MYSPDAASDVLLRNRGHEGVSGFERIDASAPNGAVPVVGNFGGSEFIEVCAVNISGDYVPYTEDFDGDGCTDILWYDPVAPNNPSPVWRCLPETKTFSCSDQLPTPKAAYPVGRDPRGY